MYSAGFVDESKCVGCRLCTQVCPEPNAVRFLASRKKSFIVAARCKGCGLCAVMCPKQAIEVRQITLAEVNACEVTCME
ncbi:MAG: 4Fe-4S binding protein [Actinobacteria bacterium]|nr:4Fe-4S binding protein [Actinomycetota bacterium]